MSKAECNRAYLKHKNAMEASMRLPKVSNVAEIFKRKPYSTSNYTEGERDEQRRSAERSPDTVEG